MGDTLDKNFDVQNGMVYAGAESLENVHQYSYGELKTATKGFSIANKIGEGGFGSVYRVIFLVFYFPFVFFFFFIIIVIIKR